MGEARVNESSNVVSMPQADGPAPAATGGEKKYTASLYSSEEELSTEFVKLIHAIERELEIPIWLLVQGNGSDEKWDEISEDVYRAFLGAKREIELRKPVGLLLHSPGGQAEEGFKIIRLFQRRTDKLTTIVPSYAKSAATMMALGGHAIVMGGEAELGPLDVQILDDEEPRYESALNAVQSLERLNAYALTALDQAMTLFLARTRKRPDALLPLALQYATSMIGPLVGKIDSVALTKKSRSLKVAEDYAVRLMKEAGYPLSTAKRIASVLVERYSTHGFVIDRTEAKAFERSGSGTDSFGLGLNVTEPSDSMQGHFDELSPYLDEITAIGRLKEVGT